MRVPTTECSFYSPPSYGQAESLTHHLCAPVLRHASFKPSYKCIKGIRAYFASLTATPKVIGEAPVGIQDSELIVVGDRVLTDVVLANRMHARSQSPTRQSRTGPLAIWTTAVWKKESMFLRWGERKLVQAVERWSKNKDVDSQPREDTRKFIKRPQEKVVDDRKGLGRWLFRRFGRT